MKWSMPESFMDIARVGLARPFSDSEEYRTALLPPSRRAFHISSVNLGAGNKAVAFSEDLDYPDWKAGHKMPYEDDDIDRFYAFHFFEHLNKGQIIHVLREVERCLVVGGSLLTVTPHWSSEAAHQDLDHKSFWSESTWRNLFENPYYEGTMPRDWKLEERETWIMGLVQRNLMIVSEVVKVA